jgi:Tol biopolymer transport system component
VTPTDESRTPRGSAGPRGLLVSLLALTLALLVGCGSEDTIKPGTDPDAVVWTKLTNFPRFTTHSDSVNLSDATALYPDWRGDSVVFNALDPITRQQVRLAYLDVRNPASLYVSTYPGPASWHDLGPRWVTSGVVVFASGLLTNPEKYDLYYRTVDTGANRRLFTWTAAERYPDPQPGGPGMVYTEGDNNLRGRLVFMADTANTVSRTYMTAPTVYAGEAQWDPTGSKVVFSADSTVQFGPRHIWWVTPGDLTSHQLTFGPYVDQFPTFSPDGSKILFVSNRSGRSSLWVMDPVAGEAGGLKRIAWEDVGARIESPTWSDDGTRIIVTSNGRDYVRQLWMLSNLPLP